MKDGQAAGRCKFENSSIVATSLIGGSVEVAVVGQQKIPVWLATLSQGERVDDAEYAGGRNLINNAEIVLST